MAYRNPGLRNLLNEWSKPQARYASFDEARRECARLKSSSHLDDSLIGQNFCLSLARRFSDYPELFWLSAAARDRPLRVFDFGGGLGQTLLQYSQVLGAENIERWTVYELPEIVAKAHADRVTQRHAALDFTTDLTSAATSTVFLAAGALHYWETSIREIVNQLGSLPEHFLTNRSPLQKAGDGFITVQAPGNGKCLVSCGRRRF